MPFHVSRDPVNLPVLRRWCDAMGVTNPVHLDPEVAALSRFGGVVSPLAMLDVWTNPGLDYRRNSGDPIGGAFDVLDAEGYTSAVAVESHLTQERPLGLGDVVRSTVTLEAVSDEKETALGASRFVTSRRDFFVGEALVGTARFTVMKFRPATDERNPAPASAPAPVAEPIVPARDELGTVRATGLHAGDELPTVTVPITATLIVSGALMTSDYFDAHHDRDAAVRRGSRDIFMNIHTSLGLVQRCVGDWLGPNAEWRAVRTRLGVPNYPGDSMVVSAELSAVDHATGDATIAFRALNQLGSHAAGSVEVVLPL